MPVPSAVAPGPPFYIDQQHGAAEPLELLNAESKISRHDLIFGALQAVSAFLITR